MPGKPPRPKPPAAKRYPPRWPSLKAIKLGNKLLAPCLALAVVIACASAGTGDHDYALIVPGEKPICAKGPETCQRARDAIETGRWPIVPAGTWTQCIPSPGCFSAASNVIRGFNDQ